ncbi:hypothetical protein GCM10010981_37220 [Dyella nitratireducens]|uniref:Uncharacterized protein n=2 Tax=Dyella nitratireducens TaxID=1849580 RepID=A0ABQ1GIR8_9GAMM|nr:hypothetical protein GCM10010981_37220 [Dyella nitratireducens]GLQ41721.1 hypothetical protein GCM10007902_15710 [Dyella nitratireducens]
MRRVATQFGTLSGCFVSDEKTQVNGANYPLEVAFAVALFHEDSGPSTTADVDKLYVTTERRWENAQPLWNQNKAAYERYVEELVRKTSPNASQTGSMSMDQPVLVSMQRVNSSAYTVVSIRRRKISKGGNTFSFDTSEGAAIVLSKGSLVRLTIQRQFRGQGDVDAVKSEITAWAFSLAK